MKFKYKVLDGSEIVLQGIMIASSDLEARKKVGRAIREHRFKNGMVVHLNDEVLDLSNSTLYKAPIVKKLQGMPERIW